jgi:hypothetical protein
MKLTRILPLLLIFASPHVFAWTINADFENGTIGNKAEGTNDAFHDAAGDSRYADTPALSGSQSSSVTIKIGQTGFGVWGGGFKFPANLREGDEIWFRVNAYYPTSWSFECGGCTEGMKFMRIHTRAAAGGNQGYVHTFIKENGEGGKIKVSTEVNGDKFNYPAPVGVPIQRDQWHTFEMYVKFSSVASEGKYRVWQDGNLIYENLNYPTLVSSSSEADRIYLYTYWNNGAPQTQTSYVDDIVITNEVPGRKDANGNSFIGVGPSIYIAPPKPPKLELVN